jgi:hypothetical protein
VYKQIHFAYSGNMNCKIPFEYFPYSEYSSYSDSVCIFLICKQVHSLIQSVLSHYTYRFIPRIRKVRPNNLEYLEYNYFLLSFKGTILHKKVCQCATVPKTTGIIDWSSSNVSENSNLYSKII